MLWCLQGLISIAFIIDIYSLNLFFFQKFPVTVLLSRFLSNHIHFRCIGNFLFLYRFIIHTHIQQSAHHTDSNNKNDE